MPSDYEPLPVKELDLGYNFLHNLHGDLFEHLEHVETLILSNNIFGLMDNPTSNAIGSLRNLKVCLQIILQMQFIIIYVFHLK